MTSVVIPDLTGTRPHLVVDTTPEDDERLVAWMGRFVSDGVRRFGSLDAFTDALTAYNQLHDIAQGIAS